MVELNLQVARDIARRYRGRDIDLDDLEQVACLGLMKAVRRFDPSRAEDFLSFAVPTIRGEVRRYFRDHGWMVRPPRSIQETQAKVRIAEETLIQEFGRSPRPLETAEHLGLPPELVREALAVNGCFVPSSLDASSTHSETSLLGASLGTDERGFAAAEARVTLAPVLSSLSDRERLVLDLRFVHGRTQSEIGEEIGASQMKVSRMLAAILAKLRCTLEPAL